MCTTVFADPYGPTINQIIKKYKVTRNFDHLIDNMAIESLPLRLGMSEIDVYKLVASSKYYRIKSKKDSKIEISNEDNVDIFNLLSYYVQFEKGSVVKIETSTVNNFEAENEDFEELKALKKNRINECWVNQNFIDVNSHRNGFDFLISVSFNSLDPIIKDEEAACMGSDRAYIVIAKPGLLYKNQIKK